MSDSGPITPTNIAKTLIQSFESGRLARGDDSDDDQFREEILVTKPGLTKELVETYESFNKKPDPTYSVLIVFAHWERNGSVDGAMLDAAVNTLEEQGHSVTVSDLYSMGFNPLASKADIKGMLVGMVGVE